MNRLHTDRELLRCIFEMYRREYPSSADPWIAIDLKLVAKHLQCHAELLFGRLYHDLGHRYHYLENGTHTRIFEMTVGKRHHCIQFPYLVAVLAETEAEHRRHLWPLWTSVAALVTSAVALALQFAGIK